MYYACGTVSSGLTGVSHVKRPDSRPPPGQRREWRFFGRIHGASGPPARCGHCSDRQRRDLDQRPMVVSVQSSVRRYLLIAGGLLLRAAASIWTCRKVAPCIAAYAAKLTPDSIVGAVTPRLSASRASIVRLRVANFT